MNASPQFASVLDEPGMTRLLEQDRALVALGRQVCVLKAIGWPASLEAKFLEQWRQGRPELPQPPTAPVDLSSTVDGHRRRLRQFGLAAAPLFEELRLQRGRPADRL